MTFTLPALPFAKDALKPFISEETIEYHYGKHHQTYVTNLNKLIDGTAFEKKNLTDIVKTSSGTIFNNAAQHINHTFYWNCLTPQNNIKPSTELDSAIIQTYNSFEEFKTTFIKSALSLFGSGWTWLVKNKMDELSIINMGNAGNPILDKLTPLLVCDVWEHAYYIDTRNARDKYVNNFWEIINWNFVNQNFLREGVSK